MSQNDKESINYHNKVILAPMVRIGTLPMRLLALKYGADLVYSEEIIDYRLLRCKRIENDVLGTIDFIDDDRNVVFRTCQFEKDKVILQLGTCDADRALRAAKLVEDDVAAIDVNMGCPKEFSIKGGMGAALLSHPQKIKAILTKLVKNMKIPVTCKIRVLHEINACIELVKMIEETGVKAIAVHGRTKDERPQHKNRDYVIKAIASALTIPVIANGGSSVILKNSDIDVFRFKTKASSVMLARAAEHNCSIFSKRDHLLPIDDVICDYLKIAIDYDNHVTNTKYCVQQMMGSLQESSRGRALLSAQHMKDICKLWNMHDYYDAQSESILKKTQKLSQINNLCEDNKNIVKRLKIDNEHDVIEMPLIFIKKLFDDNSLPRSILYSWTKNKSLTTPIYRCFQVEKHFYAIVTVDGKHYSSTYLEKNKRYAEQGAALVAIHSLNLLPNNSIIKDCLLKGAPHERINNNHLTPLNDA